MRSRSAGLSCWVQATISCECRDGLPNAPGSHDILDFSDCLGAFFRPRNTTRKTFVWAVAAHRAHPVYFAGIDDEFWIYFMSLGACCAYGKSGGVSFLLPGSEPAYRLRICKSTCIRIIRLSGWLKCHVPSRCHVILRE